MVVPKGWKKVRLEEVVEFLDNDRRPVKSSERERMKGIYPYYGASGVVGYVNEYLFDEPLILMGEDGENILSRNLPLVFLAEGKIWVNNHAHVLRPTNKVDRVFLCGYLESLNYTDLNSGTAQPKLNKESCKNIIVFLPPLEEQTAIAEALSDADSLIASLEKLIAKKKAIKQGAMQELLTGRKRLPGFRGEWKQISIGNELYSQVDYENLPSSTPPDYTFSYITLENVDNGSLREMIKCQYATAPSRARRVVHNNDVLFGTVRPNLHSHLFISNECNNVICSTGFCVIGCYSDMLNATFLYFKLFSAEIDRQVESIISGSNYPALSSTDVKSLNITIPPSIEEQTAIATILSDMDAEIEQLEKKLAKYRHIKQGMMQELLTGRIRLVEPTAQSHDLNETNFVTKGHNQHYDDAIAISAIVNKFYDNRFALGRVKIQKLLYLLRRKQAVDVSAFKKKAAGPYNEEARYKGGEAIAYKSGYIVRESGDKGSRFSKGNNIAEALKYSDTMQPDIDWLFSRFRYYNTNKNERNLEVLATVDMAVCELRKAGLPVSVDAVKNVIRSNKEWAPKLKKEFFVDTAIQQAIDESIELFD